MNFEIAPKETEITTTWYDAKLYCFVLNIDGKTGWRLPTKEELNVIFKSDNDFDTWYYWSATETDCGGAWIQSMYNGNQGYGNKNYGEVCARAVRTI